MDILILSNFCLNFDEKDNGRFSYLAKVLSKNNEVEVVTSSFNHMNKTQRDNEMIDWPFKITFLKEIGYPRNVCLQRFYSHFLWGMKLNKYLKKRKKPDVVYCAVPSLTGPFLASKYCNKNKIRFIVDVQDLWPEAFKLVFNIPIISDVVFSPFSYLEDTIYKNADDIVGVSQTYVDRAKKVNTKAKNVIPVFLGTDLSSFDENKKTSIDIEKNPGELWLGYCGTLGSSYDINCVLDALNLVENPPMFIVMGDGPLKQEFENHSKEKNVKCLFTGNLTYDKMCAMLAKCDMVVNPIHKGAAQSIINKHGDYAAIGLPVLNTQDSEEYTRLVDTYKMGLNSKPGDAKELASNIELLARDKDLRIKMGIAARKCAEENFDRKTTYKQIERIIVE